MTNGHSIVALGKPKLRYLGSKPLAEDSFRGVFTGEAIRGADLGVRLNGGQQVGVAYYEHLDDDLLDERFDAGPMRRMRRDATHVDIPFDYETRGGKKVVVYSNARYYKKRVW